MPELAEVELARRIWEPGTGQQIVAVDSHPHTRVYRDTPASVIESTLPNTFIDSSRTHGKRLLFSFKNGSPCKSTGTHPTTHLELHLGMSGRLFLAGPDHEPAKHDHLILRTTRLALV
ncbi:MAG: DNA-formamidopyrimidine glycosylase family protein, partial [Roseibacillus sp.]|nr:DNA-formamidopyrimidine glycosylase family protein [Roseibacillus sp.]